jgi:hypothetical protein
MTQVVNAVARNQARLEIPEGLLGKLIAGMLKVLSPLYLSS